MQPPGRQLPEQRKAEGLRRAVTASDTRYSRQIDAMATGLSRLIKRLEAIELRLRPFVVVGEGQSPAPAMRSTGPLGCPAN